MFMVNALRVGAKCSENVPGMEMRLAVLKSRIVRLYIQLPGAKLIVGSVCP